MLPLFGVALKGVHMTSKRIILFYFGPSLLAYVPLLPSVLSLPSDFSPLVDLNAREATWEVVRIQVVSSRLLQVQKIRENDRK